MISRLIVVTVGLAMWSWGALSATVEYDPAGSGTWGDATRWKNGATFAESDTVLINGCTGLVTDADAAYLASAAAITFSGTAPCLAVSNDVDFAAAPSIAGKGTLLKLGTGEFNLNSYEKFANGAICYVDVVIKNGTLSLQGAKATTSNAIMIKNLTVWAPGRFMGSQYASIDFDGGLYGDGTIDNYTKGQSNRTMSFSGSSDPANPAVFSGKFIRDAYYCSRTSGGYQHLIGTESTADKGMLLYKNETAMQVVGISSFGSTTGVKAPWGTAQVQWRGFYNHLLYLGTGEITERTFYYGNGGKMPLLDAGEHGGLELRGGWSINKLECNFMNGADFAGHGTNVFNANFLTTTNKNGRPIAVYVRKLGPGAWRFTSGKTREMAGVFETVEGELQFDSIAEKGVTCALGDATVLHQRYCAQIDDAKAVPYAYLLGNGTNDISSPTLATMNYTGPVGAQISTRPIAVKGAGRLKSDGQTLSWDGITTAQAGNHTIVLGGDAGFSSAGAITNGPGSLTVAKDGAGNWSLGGDVDATGGFIVNSGKLLIPNATKYEWYRLTLMGSFAEATNAAGTVMSTISGNDGSRFVLNQWALLDENGVNQIQGLTHNEAADGQPWELAPGEAAMANTNYCYLGFNSGNAWKYVLENLFISVNTFAAMNCTYSAGANGTVNTNELVWSAPRAYVADETRHVKVVVRLPENANPVKYYDLKSAGAWPNEGSQTVRIPRSWKLEGSADGIRWDTLDTVISNSQDNIVTSTGGSQKWFSNNGTALGTGYGPFACETTPAMRPAKVDVVSAAAGAILETKVPIAADALKYDCSAGGGTIRGFTLSADAQVYVNGLADSQLGATLPLTFEGADAYAGRKFAVTLNGVSRPAYSAFLSSAGLKVVRKGVTMIFR